MLTDGRFVAPYDSYYGDGDWDAAMAIFDANGKLVRDVGYAPGTVDRFTDGAMAPSGNSVLVWTTSYPWGLPFQVTFMAGYMMLVAISSNH